MEVVREERERDLTQVVIPIGDDPKMPFSKLYC